MQLIHKKIPTKTPTPPLQPWGLHWRIPEVTVSAIYLATLQIYYCCLSFCTFVRKRTKATKILERDPRDTKMGLCALSLHLGLFISIWSIENNSWILQLIKNLNVHHYINLINYTESEIYLEFPLQVMVLIILKYSLHFMHHHLWRRTPKHLQT